MQRDNHKEAKLSVLDVTIRDGSYAIDYQYQPEQVGEIVSKLDAAGIDLIEVSHGCGLGARENLGIPAAASDAEYVLAARKRATRAKIGVIAGPRPVTTPKEIDAIIEPVDFMRFAANCDDPLRVEENIAYAKRKRPDLPIFLQLMRSTRRDLEALCQAADKVEQMGVQTLYLVDTAGHFLPEQVSQIVTALITGRQEMQVGFHGHNNLGLALANTLAAVAAGATSVDASLRGIGRAGGNAQIEALTSLLHRMGLRQDIDLDALLAAGTELIEPIMPIQAGIDAVDVLTADVNIDLYPLHFYELIAEKAGIPFSLLVRTIAEGGSFVEVGIDEINRALTRLGHDPDRVFKAMGIETQG